MHKSSLSFLVYMPTLLSSGLKDLKATVFILAGFLHDPVWRILLSDFHMELSTSWLN